MKDGPGRLKWPELVKGKLVRRYKRFIVDVELDDGSTVSAHCPNTGRMTGCCEPGREVWLSTHDNPKRRLKFTLEAISMPDSMVGVNTMTPNRLVEKAVADHVVPELSGYDEIRREAPYGKNSRIDLFLSAEQRRNCLVEVKNCTMVENRTAMFPDAVTKRGLKHLEELENAASQNIRSVMFFLVQRMDADSFRPADHVDPEYGEKLREAYQNNVEVFAWDVIMDHTGIVINRSLPVLL